MSLTADDTRQQLLSAALKRRQPSQRLFDSRQALGLVHNTCDNTTSSQRDTTANDSRNAQGVEYVIPPTKWGQPFVVEAAYSSESYPSESKW